MGFDVMFLNFVDPATTGVRDSEIRSFSLDLYDLDDNRINSNEFMINLQNQTDDKSRVDSSEERLEDFITEKKEGGKEKIELQLKLLNRSKNLRFFAGSSLFLMSVS